jgi:GNAT superfamily N-acetyltransferase
MVMDGTSGRVIAGVAMPRGESKTGDIDRFPAVGENGAMSLTVRPATLADFDGMLALDSGYPHGSPRAIAVHAWVAAGCAYVAVDESPVGYAVMTRSFFDRAFIELLMVGAQFRRRGIASAMLAHLEDISPTPRLWTSTNESNAPMRALLESRSYIHSGTIEGVDDGDPEMFFRKHVRPD